MSKAIWHVIGYIYILYGRAGHFGQGRNYTRDKSMKREDPNGKMKQRKKDRKGFGPFFWLLEPGLIIYIL